MAPLRLALPLRMIERTARIGMRLTTKALSIGRNLCAAVRKRPVSSDFGMRLQRRVLAYSVEKLRNNIL
jgi:hypothetical protein